MDYDAANASTSTTSTGSSYNLNIGPFGVPGDGQVWDIYFNPREIPMDGTIATPSEDATQDLLSNEAGQCLDFPDFSLGIDNFPDFPLGIDMTSQSEFDLIMEEDIIRYERLLDRPV